MQSCLDDDHAMMLEAHDNDNNTKNNSNNEFSYGNTAAAAGNTDNTDNNNKNGTDVGFFESVFDEIGAKDEQQDQLLLRVLEPTPIGKRVRIVPRLSAKDSVAHLAKTVDCPSLLRLFRPVHHSDPSGGGDIVPSYASSYATGMAASSFGNNKFFNVPASQHDDDQHDNDQHNDGHASSHGWHISSPLIHPHQQERSPTDKRKRVGSGSNHDAAAIDAKASNPSGMFLPSSNDTKKTKTGSTSFDWDHVSSIYNDRLFAASSARTTTTTSSSSSGSTTPPHPQTDTIKSHYPSNFSPAFFGGTIGGHERQQAVSISNAKAAAVSSSPSSTNFRRFQEDLWSFRFRELCQYRDQHGDVFVPARYAANPQLSQWVKRQRYHYKLRNDGMHSNLTDERMRALDEVGFCWDIHSTLWQERYQELVAYKQHHGDCHVRTPYPDNPQLAVWVKYQRRQYKLLDEGKPSNMTQERIHKLNGLGFAWYGRDVMTSHRASNNGK